MSPGDVGPNVHSELEKVSEICVSLKQLKLFRAFGIDSNLEIPFSRRAA
jgi:hypothetical protein